MRILFVAMSDSVHTARWIGQIADRGWDLHLFPSIDTDTAHAELGRVTVHPSFHGDRRGVGPGTRLRGVPLGSWAAAYFARKAFEVFRPEHRVAALSRLLLRLRPHVVHSLEFQRAGYLTLAAKDRLNGKFPTWIATNWGSDIYLFGRVPAHKERIARILAECDYYSCECRRDVDLARQLGLRGDALPVIPNAGGFDLAEAAALRVSGPPSKRRAIMLKGYQNWAGRALVGLRALERCADLLAGYQVVIHSANDDVGLAADLFASSTGVETVVLPPKTSHREVLAHYGKARVSIGLSIGDAISTSFLEALLMGSFPIQSFTSCANEWAEHGRDALLVPPEDPEEVEAALRLALTDDALVDQAAARNWQTATERLDRTRIQPKVVEMYERIAARSRTNRPT
jgi:glycosyltransferase involved in cell wall biosynthesis